MEQKMVEWSIDVRQWSVVIGELSLVIELRNTVAGQCTTVIRHRTSLLIDCGIVLVSGVLIRKGPL